MLAKNGIELSF